MYILRYLKEKGSRDSDGQLIISEYRLLCSGELYNPRVQTFDHRKSGVARRLILKPFELIVSSQPYDAYPQELTLRFASRYQTEGTDRFSLSLLPDDEIARDIAALLTLFSRRLVVVYGKVREIHRLSATDTLDIPLPITASRDLRSWSRRPLQLVFGLAGIEDIVDENPPPKELDPLWVERALVWLGEADEAASILSAARLYALAMEMIQERTDIAYQLLISTVETVATDALADYQPDREEIVPLPKMLNAF